jgi:hypothetical protein
MQLLWQEVDDDCWAYIFTFIPLSHLITNVSIVCERFSQIWNQQLETLSFNVQITKQKEQLFQILNNPGAIQRLNCLLINGKKTSNVTDDHLVQIIELVIASRIQKLTINECSYCYGFVLQDYLVTADISVPSITYLDFSKSYSFNSQALASCLERFPKLTHLNLSKVYCVDDSFIETIQHKLSQQLQVLDISGTKAISKQKLGGLFQNWPKLKSLIMADTLIDGTSFETFNFYDLSGVEQLTHLSLEGDDYLDEKAMKCISHFPSLVSLDMSYSSLSNSLLHELSTPRDGSCLSKTLQRLNLMNRSHSISADGIQSLANHMTNLSHLVLQNLSGVDDKALAYLSSSVFMQNNLKSLDISSTEITGKSIQVVFSSFINLIDLNLNQLELWRSRDYSTVFNFFSDPSVTKISKLRKLYLRGWVMLDDNLFEAMFGSHSNLGTSIELLDITHCRTLTDTSFTHTIANNLMNMRTLILDFHDSTSQITMSGINSLSKLVDTEAQHRKQMEHPNVFLDIHTIEICTDLVGTKLILI